MEEYLERCLDSLLIPSIDDIEILVVNDGSKDRSSEIAHQYADRYPSSIKVIDKENGNYGSCINVGLPVASGKYIKILDADDYFDPSNFEKFIKILKNLSVDLVISDFIKITNTNHKLETVSFNLKPNEIFNINNDPINRILFSERLQMHACCYNKLIFKDLNYFQSEGISYTDQEWMFLPLSAINTFYYFNNPIYYYVCGREGQTMSIQSFLKSTEHEIIGISRMIKIYNERKNFINEYQKKILENRLRQRFYSQFFYTFFIYYPHINFEYLDRVDNMAKEMGMEFYYSLNNIRFPRTNCRYIHFWRKNTNKKYHILFMIKCHRLLLRINSVIKNLGLK